MNKKIISLVVVLALAFTALGTTLAYFTDTDNATNTFNVGKVTIQLNEYERNAEGTELVPFTQEKELFPIVGSAQGEKDEFGMPVAENYVDKIVTITNLDEEAYVRAYIAIPTVLDNEGDASQNILHYNGGNRVMLDGSYTETNNTNADYANWKAPVKLEGTTTIDGVEYNVYYKTYNKMMGVEETLSAAWAGFYLDKGVDYDNDNGYYTINGTKINYDLSKGVAIPVFAIGVQAAGFTDADTALDTAYNTYDANGALVKVFNPWEA